MDTRTLPPVSNRADWPSSHAFEIYDDDTNDAMDLSTATEITLEIAREPGCRPELSAKLSGATIEVDGSTFIPTFTRLQMNCLCAGSYSIGITAVVDGVTVQLIAGHLPVIDGIVR